MGNVASLKNNDTFGTIFESMLQSEVFKNMHLGVRLFYVYCRVHSRTDECRQCLHEHMKEDSTQYNYDDCFVFPAKHIINYGFDRRNAHRYFKELEQKGFIKRIEKNNHRYKVNVYCFSDEWKKYNIPGPDAVVPGSDAHK